MEEARVFCHLCKSILSSNPFPMQLDITVLCNTCEKLLRARVAELVDECRSAKDRMWENGHENERLQIENERLRNENEKLLWFYEVLELYQEEWWTEEIEGRSESGAIELKNIYNVAEAALKEVDSE